MQENKTNEISDQVAWKFRKVSERLTRSPRVLRNRLSPSRLSERRDLMFGFLLLALTAPVHWPYLSICSNFSVTGRSFLVCWKLATVMAERRSPSWTSKALFMTRSVYCAVRFWTFRDPTAVSSRSSTQNTTFSCKRLEQATRLSCEYEDKRFHSTAFRNHFRYSRSELFVSISHMHSNESDFYCTLRLIWNKSNVAVNLAQNYPNRLLIFSRFSPVVGANQWPAIGKQIRDLQCWNNFPSPRNTRTGSMR